MPIGVMGKVLWVNLSDGTSREEAIPELVYRRYLSGIGLAAYLLQREIPAGADPLGPENVLAFTSGILTGTPTLFTGRWLAAAKSPLTGTWGEANCGGTLALAIKRAGYDAILVRGISPKPVTLQVMNDRVTLEDAADLWGLDTVETERRLQAGCGAGCAVATIGPAGERLSLIAGICNDYGRLAARSGLGAVMGSKRLKAVVLQGKHKIEAADPTTMQRLTRRVKRWVSLQPPLTPGKTTKHLGTLLGKPPITIAQDGILYKFILEKWGTIGMNQVSLAMGDAPIKNWRGDSTDFSFRRSDALDPDLIIARQDKRYRCRACALGCGGLLHEDAEGNQGHKPEYETVTAWGSLLMNDDLESIFTANEKLNRAGMDSISAGGTVAFALEAYERGLITQEDTGGLELTWGNVPAILALLELMIARQGIGDLLADGARRAAEKLGHGAAEFAVHAGGQELAMHDPRNDPGFGLHAAVEAAPGRHTAGAQLYYEMFQLWTKVKGLPHPSGVYAKDRRYEPTPENIAAAAANSQYIGLLNGAGLCLFGAFLGAQRLPVFDWLNTAAGWQLSPEEYLEIGRSIQSLKQAFNARQGCRLRAEVTPRALGLPPQVHGPNKDRSIDLDAWIPKYWAAMGWDPETGAPMEEMGAGI